MKDNRKNTRFTLRLSQEDVEALEGFARKTKRTKADAIRTAVRIVFQLYESGDNSEDLSSQTHSENIAPT